MPLRTIDKVGRVLSLFSFERPEWGVSEVAEALGLPKSGAHALVSSLAGRGLLRRIRGGRYRLGWDLLSLSEVLMQTAEFRLRAQPAMEYLASRFGDAVHLAVLQEDRIVILEKVVGIRALQIPATGRGLQLPAHSSGLGKALLAHHPWEEVERFFREGMPALTPNTISSLGALREELEQVRERRYACDHEETIPSVACVAAPIRDRSGEAVAAMSFSVPAYRFAQGKERYAAAVVETARSVSESLGGFAITQGRRHRAQSEIRA